MHLTSRLRPSLIVCMVIVAASVTAAKADSGSVRISVLKGGWVIGASGGNGTLTFQGRRYPLSIGGLSYGFVFGASQTHLTGRVSNIRNASDIAGVYGAAGAGAVVGSGARGIVMRNEKGAVLELSGQQRGLMVNADLSGMAISMR
jgi:hypothetical protein